jgi:pyridoxal/pyridoxine/pyridoxamine kinase
LTIFYLTILLLLAGYIGNAATLQVCREAIERIKSTNSVIFGTCIKLIEAFSRKMLMAMISFNYCTVCDPVMGDDGSLYVSPEVLPLYRELICMADIVTPNQTEAEYVSINIYFILKCYFGILRDS